MLIAAKSKVPKKQTSNFHVIDIFVGILTDV